MTVLDTIKKRYAAKNFSGEKIPEDKVFQMKESIRLAPSSFNWQPWKIKIIENKDLLEELQGASWNQPQIGSASHLFVFCSVDSIEENCKKVTEAIRNVAPKKADMYDNMASGALSQMGLNEQKAMSERELFMAVENLLLAATDLGYAACPVGGFDAKKYSEILEIPENLKPIVVVPVGVPTDEARPKFRFSDEEIFF